MQLAVLIIFLVLILSAPWLSRKWGWIAEVAWGIITMVFLIVVIMVLP